MGGGHVDEPGQPGTEPSGVRIVALLGALLMGLTVTLTFCQVVMRTLFDAPQTWLEEVSRYIFVWVVFLGSALACFRGSHVRLDVVDLLATSGTRKAIVWPRLAIEVLAGGLLLYSGIIVAWRNRGSDFYTLPGMPQVVFYLSVPVGAVLCIWFLLHRASLGQQTAQNESVAVKES